MLDPELDTQVPTSEVWFVAARAINSLFFISNKALIFHFYRKTNRQNVLQSINQVKIKIGKNSDVLCLKVINGKSEKEITIFIY